MRKSPATQFSSNSSYLSRLSQTETSRSDVCREGSVFLKRDRIAPYLGIHSLNVSNSFQEHFARVHETRYVVPPNPINQERPGVSPSGHFPPCSKFWYWGTTGLVRRLLCLRSLVRPSGPSALLASQVIKALSITLFFCYTLSIRVGCTSMCSYRSYAQHHVPKSDYNLNEAVSIFSRSMPNLFLARRSPLQNAINYVVDFWLELCPRTRLLLL